MPNHFHGIVVIVRDGRGDRPVAPTVGPQPRSLGAVMAGFKSAVTKRINEIRNTPGVSVWQRNYYERIIRDGQPFEEKMARLTAALREQTEQSAKLEQIIWANLEDIGYGG